MATTSTAGPSAVPVGNAQEIDKLAVPNDEHSPASDSGGEDEPLYADQDDAQSIIQPSLSPIATRLTSPKTPAAEKAAAMENIPGGGLFSVIEDSTSTGTIPQQQEHEVSDGATSPRKLSKSPSSSSKRQSLRQLPNSQSHQFHLNRPPSPWQSGPKKLVLDGTEGTRLLSGVFGDTRHRRSSSGGAEALRRIREALPTINLPSNFLSSFTPASFFSAPSGPKAPAPETKQTLMQTDGSAESKQVAPYDTTNPEVRENIPPNNRQSITGTPRRSPSNGSSRPPSGIPSRPRPIRRSTSDESMLFHSLSRVSSLGDDDRWGHVREQTNSRLKAIRDSWDRPSFKLPQMPKLPEALKRNPLMGSEDSDYSKAIPSPRTPHYASFPKESSVSELDRALESLTGDVVIMGGYRGSILRSTKTNRQVWVPVKVGLKIRKVNLEVGLDPEDEERMEESIYPSGMLQNIGPVDISKRLFKKLRECDNAKAGKLRVWDYGWDWRLSPHLLSRKLISFLEKLPSNNDGQPGSRGATVIAHSLGGLITRHAVNQRPELFSGVLYAGTPQRCINILGPLRNGDAVLLNEKVLTAQVNFSLRTSFVFLPEDGYCFINKHTGEEYPVDFYDANSWAQYSLSPAIEPALPAYNTRHGSLGSLFNLSGSLQNLPLRSRGNSAAGEHRPPQSPRNLIADAARRTEVANDHSLAPQMGNLAGGSRNAQPQQSSEEFNTQNKYMEYLTRTLGEIKQFRTELAYQPRLSAQYPPFAVIYGKDIPTVYGAHVTCREAIACSDCYDDLLFRSGDGVVLAKEAMLPEGYSVVKGGRLSTDRGHITMLGDLEVVGKALGAIVKGRQKGIGLGIPFPA